MASPSTTHVSTFTLLNLATLNNHEFNNAQHNATHRNSNSHIHVSTWTIVLLTMQPSRTQGIRSQCHHRYTTRFHVKQWMSSCIPCDTSLVQSRTSEQPIELWIMLAMLSHNHRTLQNEVKKKRATNRTMNYAGHVVTQLSYIQMKSRTNEQPIQLWIMLAIISHNPPTLQNAWWHWWNGGLPWCHHGGLPWWHIYTMGDSHDAIIAFTCTKKSPVTYDGDMHLKQTHDRIF